MVWNDNIIYNSVMKRVLISWLGRNDLESPGLKENINATHARDRLSDLGPVASTLLQEHFDEVRILSNYEPAYFGGFKDWISCLCAADIDIRHVPMEDPMDLEVILAASRRLVEEVAAAREDPEITYHISPGTSAMAISLVICESTVYNGRIIQSSREAGLREFHLPLVVSVAMRRRVDERRDREMNTLASGNLLPDAAFSRISARSPSVRTAVNRASRFARFDRPVLLMGENGTGKEVFANSIHNASPAREGPFIPVNCGAIPESLLESELFGYEKGAFTGAVASRPGFVRRAHGGTLFLDEIGELSRNAQVKLLRVLQEREVTPVGGGKATPVNFRLVTATNRDLLKDVREGRFREDLFHRIANGIVHLPPLRERPDDIRPLIDELLHETVRRLRDIEPEFTERAFDEEALEVMLAYRWPGNIRELQNSIYRICISSEQEVIDAELVKSQLLYFESADPEGSGGDEVEQTGRLPMHPEELAAAESIPIDPAVRQLYANYLAEAQRRGNGVYKEMARILETGNYQNVQNWMKKYPPEVPGE
jgi:transcriptional regulator with PAS, ATPase and Fis domain